MKLKIKIIAIISFLFLTVNLLGQDKKSVDFTLEQKIENKGIILDSKTLVTLDSILKLNKVESDSIYLNITNFIKNDVVLLKKEKIMESRAKLYFPILLLISLILLIWSTIWGERIIQIVFGLLFIVAVTITGIYLPDIIIYIQGNPISILNIIFK